MTVIDLDALVSENRLPKVRLYGREVMVRPMSGAMAHRLAMLQTDDPNGTKMFTVLLELVARSIPELTPDEVDGLSMEQVTALVQLTRGQVQDVETMLAERHEAQDAGK
jgi:hypothetical protein